MGVQRFYNVGGNFLKKFRIVQALPIGNSIIVHNLALVSPFAVEVEVRDASTGGWIGITIVSESTNSVVLDSGAAISSARITVIG